MENGGLADVDPRGAAVIDVDLVAVVDGDITGLGELAGALKGRAVQGRDHVDGTRGRAEGVLQFAFLRRGGIVSVGDMEYFGRWAPGGGAMRRVAGEGRAG